MDSDIEHRLQEPPEYRHPIMKRARRDAVAHLGADPDQGLYGTCDREGQGQTFVPGCQHYISSRVQQYIIVANRRTPAEIQDTRAGRQIAPEPLRLRGDGLARLPTQPPALMMTIRQAWRKSYP